MLCSSVHSVYLAILHSELGLHNLLLQIFPLWKKSNKTTKQNWNMHIPTFTCITAPVESKRKAWYIVLPVMYISYVEVHLCKLCGSQWTITLNLEFSRFPFHTILTDKRTFYLFLVKKLLTSLSVFSPFFFAFPSECFFALVFLLTLQERMRMQLLQSAHTWNTYTFYVRIFFGLYILVWHMYYR